MECKFLYSFTCDFKFMKNMRSERLYPSFLKMLLFDCDWQFLKNDWQTLMSFDKNDSLKYFECYILNELSC